MSASSVDSSTVARPAPVVIAGEQQLAPAQLADECEGVVDTSERESPSTQTVSSG